LNIPKISKPTSVFIVIGDCFLSFAIANLGVNYDRMELGALFPILINPIISVAAFMLFIFIDWGFPEIRFWSFAITLIFILAWGIYIRSGI
jgi:hypothetical protein